MNPFNKVAWITGGARMGAVVAEELAKKGCHIVLSYRKSKNEAVFTQNQLRKHKVEVLVIKSELSKEKAVTSAIKKIHRHFKKLDILINMASIYEKNPLLKLNEKSLNKNINSNLKSAYLTSIKCFPLLKKGGGRIINISDWVAASGRPRYPHFIPYYTSKTAILGLTQSTALEMAPHVLVNCIAPGPIIPPPKMKTEETNAVKKVTPLKKWGGPLEIAKGIMFLINSDFITGECIRIDGGRHLL